MPPFLMIVYLIFIFDQNVLQAPLLDSRLWVGTAQVVSGGRVRGMQFNCVWWQVWPDADRGVRTLCVGRYCAQPRQFRSVVAVSRAVRHVDV